jgi:hypothetical protein
MILVAAFSVFANYGILVRQRSQLLPMFFIFLTVPPRSWSSKTDDVPIRELERRALRGGKN